jgi:hypothetical protein
MYSSRSANSVWRGAAANWIGRFVSLHSHIYIAGGAVILLRARHSAGSAHQRNYGAFGHSLEGIGRIFGLRSDFVDRFGLVTSFVAPRLSKSRLSIESTKNECEGVVSVRIEECTSN